MLGPFSITFSTFPKFFCFHLRVDVRVVIVGRIFVVFSAGTSATTFISSSAISLIGIAFASSAEITERAANASFLISLSESFCNSFKGSITESILSGKFL